MPDFELPNLRDLPPKARKAAVEEYHKSLRPQGDASGAFDVTRLGLPASKSSTVTKTVASPQTARAAVVNALVDVGGDYMGDLPETVAALYIGADDAAAIDSSHLPHIWESLANDPEEMSRLIAEAKIAKPEQFTDVSRLARIKSPLDRLGAKMQAIARARDSRVHVARLQGQMLRSTLAKKT